ncbi:MAG: hypothetical protein GTN40_05725 [Candidatus Aenigmarchaeota archaeon]|nr:hypothetical protein [Candidatus Aenigmarchaeota archaeon]
MAYFFIITAVILRILPHAPNFAPIAAMALFGGTYLNKKYALLVPLAAMFISDYFIGFYDLKLEFTVWGSFLLVGLIGLWLRKHKNLRNIIGATLLGSVLFFIVTNFTVWAFSSWYPRTIQGLVQCYIMAIPFFRNTILGDLFYVGILFGSYEIVLYLVKNKRYLQYLKKY